MTSFQLISVHHLPSYIASFPLTFHQSSVFCFVSCFQSCFFPLVSRLSGRYLKLASETGRSHRTAIAFDCCKLRAELCSLAKHLSSFKEFFDVLGEHQLVSLLLYPDALPERRFDLVGLKTGLLDGLQIGIIVFF